MPAPAKVTFLLAEKSPLRVSVPLSDAIVASLLKVTEPEKALLPLTLRSAPPLPTPVPERSTLASATVRPPCSARVAPDDTVLP